jgi:hypothetical protein
MEWNSYGQFDGIITIFIVRDSVIHNNRFSGCDCNYKRDNDIARYNNKKNSKTKKNTFLFNFEKDIMILL